MDLTRATGEGIGSTLDRSGLTWSFDKDGDVQVAFRSSRQPWTDAVFYQLDTTDWRVRGQFLNARAVPQGNGMTSWEVSPDRGSKPTAVARKVVTMYLMPRPGHVLVQIHARIEPLEQPIEIRGITPESAQLGKIERDYPGFVGRTGDRQFWMSCGVTGTDVDEYDFLDMVARGRDVGLAMFDGPFTGWLYSPEL